MLSRNRQYMPTHLWYPPRISRQISGEQKFWSAMLWLERKLHWTSSSFGSIISLHLFSSHHGIYFFREANEGAAAVTIIFYLQIVCQKTLFYCQYLQSTVDLFVPELLPRFCIGLLDLLRFREQQAFAVQRTTNAKTVWLTLETRTCSLLSLLE